MRAPTRVARCLNSIEHKMRSCSRCTRASSRSNAREVNRARALQNFVRLPFGAQSALAPLIVFCHLSLSSSSRSSSLPIARGCASACWTSERGERKLAKSARITPTHIARLAADAHAQSPLARAIIPAARPTAVARSDSKREGCRKIRLALRFFVFAAQPPLDAVQRVLTFAVYFLSFFLSIFALANRRRRRHKSCTPWAVERRRRLSAHFGITSERSPLDPQTKRLTNLHAPRGSTASSRRDAYFRLSSSPSLRAAAIGDSSGARARSILAPT